jgi:hypothetical protein
MHCLIVSIVTLCRHQLLRRFRLSYVIAKNLNIGLRLFVERDMIYSNGTPSPLA